MKFLDKIFSWLNGDNSDNDIKPDHELNAKIADGVNLLRDNLDIQLKHINSHLTEEKLETMSEYEKTYWTTYKAHIEATRKTVSDILAGKLHRHTV